MDAVTLCESLANSEAINFSLAVAKTVFDTVLAYYPSPITALAAVFVNAASVLFQPLLGFSCPYGAAAFAAINRLNSNNFSLQATVDYQGIVLLDDPPATSLPASFKDVNFVGVGCNAMLSGTYTGTAQGLPPIQANYTVPASLIFDISGPYGTTGNAELHLGPFPNGYEDTEYGHVSISGSTLTANFSGNVITFLVSGSSLSGDLENCTGNLCGVEQIHFDVIKQ